ncbi:MULTISPECIES: PTS sugar transporter subunit IIB [Clostridium]|uniref:Phosphotransferase system lactose/cellobiose-specific IIB subunit n=1 Tax=Clostridium saccharoperbutylacetonicum N1-4(HMT) TaxID=931276 RepID=M1LRE9_9CLOT|nr:MULTISPECIES: PTS sugar transporter subunit IIB [Clostridium]AGF55510.1 phosphotransferase system lactose/cellobiose-specific IIB subunit [Clostridium saccharoperbutylacetonicum N1-4(HMT)]AQR94390.1 lichenan-specific phosphotransferase enzyme IIB component [Clostridium saccharoperbutylacetonicum]NRT63771.1 PTS system cellobiose-specific IIB component [Clostridium saccharoperbutylacetonicum]NSB27134.1 PTS system cellobiose-specific IIB component [Clostridium saccharoperbutylacetonicum]NSB300
MRYITLVCAAGMSTSILMGRMQESAKKQGIEAKIVAMSESKFEEYEEPTEVLLLGPQIEYMADEMKEQYEPKGIKVAVIDMMDYGTLNGEKVLKDALALLD